MPDLQLPSQLQSITAHRSVSSWGYNGVNHLPKVVTQLRPNWESNPRPLDHKFDNWHGVPLHRTQIHCCGVTVRCAVLWVVQVTDESHVDKPYLVVAMTAMTEVAAAINEFKRRKDLGTYWCLVWLKISVCTGVLFKLCSVCMPLWLIG